jgi:hypothetical protein
MNVRLKRLQTLKLVHGSMAIATSLSARRIAMGLTGMIFGRTLRKAVVPGADASILSAISLAVLRMSELNR